jgi:cytochrome b561
MKNTNYSAVYRTIHWAIAISMLLLLGTIFLRMTWMNKNNVADIIQQYLTTTDQTLSDEQLITLAKQIRKPMWQWHIYLGYVLTGLFAIRFTLPLFGEMKCRNPLDKALSFKEKFQLWTYIVFYCCIIVSLSTGLMIEFGPKGLKEPMEEIHILSIYYFATYLVLHFGGILMAELGNQQGIVSRIISGENK